MHDLRNLTNSPYHLILGDGSRAILPARGILESIDIDPRYLIQLKTCGYIEVTELSKSDSKKNKESEDIDELDDLDDFDDLDEDIHLTELYTELSGKKPDARWGDKRLISEIERLQK